MTQAPVPLVALTKPLSQYTEAEMTAWFQSQPGPQPTAAELCGLGYTKQIDKSAPFPLPPRHAFLPASLFWVAFLQPACPSKTGDS